MRSDVLTHVWVLLALMALLLQGTLELFAWVSLSLLLAWIAATLAFLTGLLTLNGRRAATALGAITLGMGGWIPALLLLFFFLSSALLGWLLDEEESKGELNEQRGAGQVWANGIWVAPLSIGYGMTNDVIYLVMITAAIAVVTADTWASVVGRSCSGATRHLFPPRSVDPGDEGGVSVTGSVAAVTASALFAILALFWLPTAHLNGFWSISAAGVVGCFVDSFLGQRRAMRVSDRSDPSGCRTADRDNNLINALASLSGVLIALSIWMGVSV